MMDVTSVFSELRKNALLKRNGFRFAVAVLLTTSIVAFQNCGKGFVVSGPSELASLTNTSIQQTNDATPVMLGKVTSAWADASDLYLAGWSCLHESSQAVLVSAVSRSATGARTSLATVTADFMDVSASDSVNSAVKAESLQACEDASGEPHGFQIKVPLVSFLPLMG